MAEALKIPHKDVGLSDFCNGSIEAIKLHLTDPKRVWIFSSMLIANLKTIYPDLTNKVLEKRNLELFNNMTGMGIYINDCFDLSRFVETEDRMDLIETSYNGWQKFRQNANLAIDKFLTPDKERQHSQSILNTYEQETLCVETQALRRDTWDLHSIKEYREVSNAVALVNLAAIVLNSERIKFSPIRDIETSYQTVLDKYQWLRDGAYQNEDERKLVGLFNVIMALQVLDDINDLQIDSQLGLNTFASQTQKDPKFMVERYTFLAQANGINKNVITAQLTGFRFLKTVMNKFPAQAGARERLFSK